MVDFERCLDNAMEIWRTHNGFTVLDEFDSEHTMDDALLVYPHDLTTFFQTITPVGFFFQEMAEVFRVNITAYIQVNDFVV